ncbi:homeobox protein MOX-1 isoform X1 [Lates japonicus]|uniref:Homeobox protein MOX-1 isoform X1 n=1 Tax=Lates japonicus TaxID=270547 RepID=A0AAD3NJD6_LATJO|nr:homeobox protein MOX-1 isoform X1 [Lates japonicus]
MGEKTASQVQDVVVAGSQSSNFLLPKENKSLSIRVPRLTMVGLCSDSGQPNKAFRGPPVQTAPGLRSDGEMVLEAMASGSGGIIHQHEGSQSALGSGCCHKGVMAAGQLNL